MIDQPSRNPDAVIEFSDVELRRGNKTLVGPVNWTVELDERWLVLGPNGAGKTSLFSIAAAREHPTVGTAWVLGEQLGRTNLRDLQPRIGVCSSLVTSKIPPNETVEDLVISAAYGIMGRWRENYEDYDHERTEYMLKQWGITHLRDRNFGTLSEGERKRVSIARALMADPELLLLDEPASGLDLGGREDLVERLQALAQDPDSPAMVMVSHHVEEIPPGFTHTLLLKNGKVQAQGLIEDNLTSSSLSETFDMPITLLRQGNRFFARRARYRGAHRSHN